MSGQGRLAQRARAEPIPSRSRRHTLFVWLAHTRQRRPPCLRSTLTGAAKMLLHTITIPRARRDPPARARIRPFRRPALATVLHPVHAVTKRSITRTIASATITLPARRRDHRDGIPVSPHELHPARENGDDLDGSQKVWVWRGIGSERGFPCATVSKARVGKSDPTDQSR